MNECKIVQDLMPLYVDDLVSQETGEFIREHLAGCEICKGHHRRMSAPLTAPEEPENYKKNLRRDVWKIILHTLLAAVAAAAVCLYGLWEWGFLDREVYKSPDGTLRFEVIDLDAGFFEGGAYIVTPDGRGRNLYGDLSYQDFHVWFSPDSEKYFVWIEFDDHDETYLRTSVYDETIDLYRSVYYPSFEIEERDFLKVLKECWQGQEFLTEDNVIITFDRWTPNSRYIYFNYEMDGGYSGEIWFDCEMLEVCNFSKNWPGALEESQ